MSLPDLSTASTKSNCPLCNKLVKVTKLGLLPSHRNQKIKCPQSGFPILSPAIPRTLNAFSALALAQPIVTIPTLTDVPTSPIVPTSTAGNALTFNPTDSTDVEIFLVIPKPFVISRIPKGARLQVAKHLSKNLTSLINNYSSIKHWLDTLSFAFTTLQVPDPASKKSLTQQIKDATIYPLPINHFSTSFKGDDTDKNKNHKNDLLIKAKLISKKLDNLNVKSAIRLATVGKDKSFVKFFADTLLEISLMRGTLSRLPAHQAFFLLKNYLLIPKILYTLRSSRIFQYDVNLAAHELEIKYLTEDILNLKFGDLSWLQATLPTKSGGIGIRSPSLLSVSAFISSRLSCEPIIHALTKHPDPLLPQAIDLWKSLSLVDPPSSTLQKDWDKPLIGNSVAYLKSWSQPEDHSLLFFISADSGYEFLEAFPSRNLDQLLSNDELRHAIGLRLNCNMVIPYHCILCQMPVNSKGRHSLHCKRCRGRFIRHSKCNDTIARALKYAGIPSTLEPTGLYNSDGKRPDGSTMIPWKRGEFLTWDFSCIDPLAPSNINRDALVDAETNKLAKYSPSLPANYTFLPLIATTLTSFGSHALAFFKELGKRISTRTEDPNEGYYLRQRLALNIIKSNYLSFIFSMTDTS
ncbi:uncharacterized protein LOC135922342 [Gordionus sp. m RMFG-2023]|uniref:uncharacterized protein LOC135922342 n=1 Tax=Gordionus sp. m RMFG-2023 TaxID=3053472 RepID=UPI0031FBE02C